MRSIVLSDDNAMTNRIIVVRLAGGLGNQLFQFAAAVQLADWQSIPNSCIYLDTTFISKYETPRKFEIGFIVEAFPGINIRPPDSILASWASRFRLARLINFRIRGLELIGSYAYLSAIKGASSSRVQCLDGYFQHPDLVFKREHIAQIHMKLRSSGAFNEQFRECSVRRTGLHIRRGDFISSKNASQVFRIIPLEYYKLALNRLPDNQKVFVFSDDPIISKQLSEELNGTDVASLRLTLQQEFCLLMNCDDYIIANSTFSWWAAVLGKSGEGKVISPGKWYLREDAEDFNPLNLPDFEVVDV